MGSAMKGHAMDAGRVMKDALSQIDITECPFEALDAAKQFCEVLKDVPAPFDAVGDLLGSIAEGLECADRAEENCKVHNKLHKNDMSSHRWCTVTIDGSLFPL